MALPLIAMGVAAVAPIIADLIGRAMSAGDREKAQRILEKAYADFGPDILKTPGVADLTPHLDTSRMATARADPEAIAAQRSALAQLQRRSTASPDDIELRAGVDAATRAANQQARGQNEALRNEMQSRGMGNTGTEYALRSQANADAADRASAGGFQAAFSADRSALDALKGFGGLSTTMRGQSFDEEARRATAADDLARWNEENRAQGNQMAFQNRLAGTTARANAGANLANAHLGNAAQIQNTASNIGQGVGAAGGQFGMYLDSQRKKYGGR